MNHAIDPIISATMALPIAIPTIAPVDTEGSSDEVVLLFEAVEVTEGSASVVLVVGTVEVMNGAAAVVLVDKTAAVRSLSGHPSGSHALVLQHPMKAVEAPIHVYQSPEEAHICGRIAS